jgi:hypothetical protein
MPQLPEDIFRVTLLGTGAPAAMFLRHIQPPKCVKLH